MRIRPGGLGRLDLVLLLAVVGVVPTVAPLSAADDEPLHGAQFVYPNRQTTVEVLAQHVRDQIAYLREQGDTERAERIAERLASAERQLENDYREPPSDQLQLHVVGLYEGRILGNLDRRAAQVRVTHTASPIILCLTAYESVVWQVELAPDVDVRQVILGGQNQFVDGLPDSVVIADLSRPTETGQGIGSAYTKPDPESGDTSYEQLEQQLRERTDLHVATFQGVYQAPDEPIVVGPESQAWRSQRAFDAVRDAYLFAFSEEHQAIWEEITQIRFPAVYRQPAGEEMLRGGQRGARTFRGMHTIFGPIEDELEEVADDAARRALDPREGGAAGEKFALTDVATGTTYELPWDEKADLPSFSNVLAAAFDSLRERWMLIGRGPEEVWMYACSAEQRDWTGVRAMYGLELHTLCYAADEDVFYGLGPGSRHHYPGGGLSLYKLHPTGAVLSRQPLTGLMAEMHFHGGSSLQLFAAGKYLIVLMPQPIFHRPAPPTVMTSVLDRLTGEVVFRLPQLEPASIQQQAERMAEHFRKNLTPQPGHLAAVPEVKTEVKVAPPQERTAKFALESPHNGHYYEFVRTDGVTWKQAVQLAEKSSYKGLPGYLVTITSEEENRFLTLNFGQAGSTWAGATDEEVEGVWMWVTGPEAGNVFYIAGAPTDGYHNWDRGGHMIEPNNMREREHYLMWNWSVGQPQDDSLAPWNDWDLERTASFIIIEYSRLDEVEERDGVVNQRADEAAADAREALRDQITHVQAFVPAWSDAWLAHGFSVEENDWFTWQGPPAVPPRGGVVASSSTRFAVVDPGPGAAGWLLSLRTGKWTRIPALPFPAAAAGGGDQAAGIEFVVGGAAQNLTGLGFAEFVGDRLAVFGAVAGEPYVAILDTESLEWTAVKRGAPIAARFRSLHGVVGSKLIVWGGYPNGLQDGAVFDLTANTWQKMSPAPVKFQYGTDCTTWQDRFIVFGGDDQRTGALYDPATDTWELISEAPDGVGCMSAVATAGDFLFVWSGYGAAAQTGALYNFRTRQWSTIARAPIAPRCLASARAIGDRILVYGGWNPSDERFVADGAIYNVASDSWTTVPAIPGETPYALHPGW